MTGPAASDLAAAGALHSRFKSLSGAVGWTHTDGDSALSTNLSLSQGDIHAQSLARYDFQAPLQASFDQNLIQTATFPDLDLTIAFKSPLPNMAKLGLGYELQLDRQGEGDQNLQGPSLASAVAAPGFAQKFRFTQQVQAAYADYERTIGGLTIKPGLRLEATRLDTDLLTADQKGAQSYFAAFPSLHLAFALDETAQLKASYGRRVLRPDESQLDPFKIFNTPTLYTAGNPDLRPSFTQTLEAGYDYRKQTTDLEATLFYRDKSNVITTLTQDIGDGVLLTTFQNLGHVREAGLELTFKRDLTPKLSLGASADLLHARIAATSLASGAAHAADIVSGQVTMNWRVTRQDVVQFGTQASGRELTAQGYIGGVVDSDFGWRHRFDDRLAAVFALTDPFGLARRTTLIQTPGVYAFEHRKFDAFAISVGLTLSFSAAPQPGATDFEFAPKPQDKP